MSGRIYIVESIEHGDSDDVVVSVAFLDAHQAHLYCSLQKDAGISSRVCCHWLHGIREAGVLIRNFRHEMKRSFSYE